MVAKAIGAGMGPHVIFFVFQHFKVTNVYCFRWIMVMAPPTPWSFLPVDSLNNLLNPKISPLAVCQPAVSSQDTSYSPVSDRY